MTRISGCWSSLKFPSVPSFDLAFSILFPLAVLLVFCRLARDFRWAELHDLLFNFKSSPAYGPFSLSRAYQSYAQYARMSASELRGMRSAYSSLGRTYKRLGNKIGYAAKLDRLEYVTHLNATITDGIAELAASEYHISDAIEKGSVSPNNGDLSRVREALRHYIRDWSSEGAEERGRIFAPILEVLKSVPLTEREHMTVLVPGCGLGRLAWEVSELGFDTTANELSYFMILAFRFLASPGATAIIDDHTLRPYSHWFSHQRSNDALFRAVKFPDALPRLSNKFKLIEGDFLKLPLPEYDASATFDSVWGRQATVGHPHGASGYDIIVTLFFIDTSPNVFSTMEHIYNLLKPGGRWINLGPLLWSSGGQTKLELSLEEVLVAAQEIGFIEDSLIERRTVECEYTADSLAMMRWIYKAEFWTMWKPISS